MARSHGDGDLIAAIYDAIIDPFRWDEVVKGIVEATKSFSGNLILQQADAGSLTALYNVDPALADAYAQTYHKNDPLRTPAWSIAPGEVRACSYTQTDSFRASAYYDEFVRPQGWAGLVGTGLARTPDSFALLALTRSPGAVWVEPAEWHLLKTLAPHLQRAAAVHTQLARTRATANLLVAAAGFAVFLLTGNCRVLFANPKAEDLLRRQIGLRYERGQLSAATPAAAAVFVVDPAAGLDTQIERFAARSGLTIGETRVLAEIIGGNGLLAAATKLKITEATARSHTNRILAKRPGRRSSCAGFLKLPCPVRRKGSIDARAAEACHPLRAIL